MYHEHASPARGEKNRGDALMPGDVMHEGRLIEIHGDPSVKSCILKRECQDSFTQGKVNLLILSQNGAERKGTDFIDLQQACE